MMDSNDRELLFDLRGASIRESSKDKRRSYILVILSSIRVKFFHTLHRHSSTVWVADEEDRPCLPGGSNSVQIFARAGTVRTSPSQRDATNKSFEPNDDQTLRGKRSVQDCVSLYLKLSPSAAVNGYDWTTGRAC